MRKLQTGSLVLALLASIVLMGCPPAGGGGDDTTTEDPTAIIGNSASFFPSTNADTSVVSNSMVALGAIPATSFAIVIDTSESLFPLTSWTEHLPIIVGAFSGFTANGGPMANWDPYNYYTNRMTAVTTSASIVITVGSVLLTNGLSNDQGYTLSFKPGNVLNTVAGTNALQADPWNVVGLIGTGANNVDVVLTNVGGDIQIVSIKVNSATQPGSLIAGDKKSVGIKINGSFSDWSIQSAGLPVIPAGTKVRIIWNGVPSGTAVPVKTNIWTTWPQGATVTGANGWLHTDNATTWNPGLGRPVQINTANSKAAVTVTLLSNIAPGFEMKLVNSVGWDNGEELNNHAGLIPAPSAGGEATIIFNADFATTNL